MQKALGFVFQNSFGFLKLTGRMSGQNHVDNLKYVNSLLTLHDSEIMLNQNNTSEQMGLISRQRQQIKMKEHRLVYPYSKLQV